MEIAIAAALGDTLDAVLLQGDQIEEALRLLESDDAGRAALLPLDGNVNHLLNQPNDADCLGIASSLINAPDDLRAAVHLLLGNTLIVSDRNAARRLIGEIPTYARIVTVRGEVFRGDGLVIAGKSASASTLSRPRQKRELTEVLSDLTSRLEVLNASITKISDELTSAQRQQTTSEAELRKARSEFDESQSAEQKAAIDLETARRQWDWQKSQHDELQKDVSAAEADRERLAALASENEAKAIEAQKSIRILTNQLNELNLDEAQEQVAYWNTRLAVIEQSVNSLQSRKSERKQSVDRFVSQQQDVQAKLGETENLLKELDEEKSILREREGVMHKQIEELRVQIEPAEKDLETAEQEETRLQEVEANAQRNLASTERMAGQIQLDLVQTRRRLG